MKRLLSLILCLAMACTLFGGAAAESAALVLPASLTEIGEEAFYGDEALRAVVVPDGALRIGERAFAFSGVTEITLPGSMAEIGEEAFAGASSLCEVTLPEGVVRLGSRAFAGSGLQKIALPESLTDIGDDPFAGCDGLTVTAPRGSIAYQWALERGYISKALEMSSPYLQGNILDFPKTAAVNSVFPVTITAEGDWTLSLRYITPSPKNWVTAGVSSGSGDGVVSLTLKSKPAQTNYTVAEIYACELTLQTASERRSYYLTVSKEGRYVNRHINTGNLREDVVQVALSQVGYRSGANGNDLSGEPTEYHDWNYTKYPLYLGYGFTSWCAAFVSWCAWQAGGQSIVGGSVTASPGKMCSSCSDVYYFNQLNSTQWSNHQYLRTRGIFSDRADCWPKRGDFIYFRWQNAAASTTFSHVGLVLGCSGGVITYVDGNGDSTDSVRICTIAHDSPDIAAYFDPWK